MINDKIFSIRLNSAMIENNMKQVDLCNKTGISKSAMSQYLSASFVPKNDKIYLLSKALKVNPEWLLGYDVSKHPLKTTEQILNILPMPKLFKVPVIGSVTCGYNGLALENFLGYETTDRTNINDCFFLLTTGDSMSPAIVDGDYALIDKSIEVQSGEVGLVVVNGEEGTIKKIIKKDGAIILQPLNSEYETKIFIGEDINTLCIVGKVVETKRKWWGYGRIYR